VKRVMDSGIKLRDGLEVSGFFTLSLSLSAVLYVVGQRAADTIKKP
jgi:hypothetical protein